MEILTALASGWAIVWTVLLFGILIATVEHELGVVSLIVLAIGIGVLELTGTTALAPWVIENPIRFMTFAALYFLAGGAWALLKWWLFVRRSRDKIAEAFGLWRKTHATEAEADFLTHSYNPVSLREENKQRILIWMMWWVPSLFWSVASDLLIGIWNRVYDLLGGGFSKIASHIVLKTIGR